MTFIQSLHERFMLHLINTLFSELVDVENEMKNRGIAAAASDDSTRDYHKELWDACIIDAKLAQTWFHIIFFSCLNHRQRVALTKADSPDPIALLLHDSDGNLFRSIDLTNKFDAGKSKDLARAIRQKELFCDLILQIIINKKNRGQSYSDWVVAISTLFKDGNLTGRIFGAINRIGLCRSQSAADEIRHVALTQFYANSIAQLQANIRETKSDAASSGVELRRVFILNVDNYAQIKFSREQVSKKTIAADGVETLSNVKSFTNVEDTLSILAIGFNKHDAYLKSESRTDNNSACVNLSPASEGTEDRLQVILNQVLNGRLDLKDTLGTVDFENMVFPSLNDYTAIASLPVKSSSHVQVAQVLQMLVTNLFEGDQNEIYLPVDPEFVLEALVYSIAYPALLKNTVVLSPPFHLQKHCMESLGGEMVFMRALMCAFHNALNFKPSVFTTLNNRIDKMCETCEMSRKEESAAAADKADLDSESSEDDESNSSESENDFNIDGLIEEARKKTEDSSSKTSIQIHFNNCAIVSDKIVTSLETIILNRSHILKYTEIMATITGPNVKEKKKAIEKLPSCVLNFNCLAKEIKKSWVTNHQRLKYNQELLWAVVKYTEAKYGTEFWNTNKLTEMIKYVIHEMLELCVEPFNLLNGHGDIKPLYESLPLFTKLICVGSKYKIVRACFFLLGQLIHLINNRPDIMHQIALMAPYTNEVIIEFQNSTLQRRLMYLEILFQNIRTESIQTTRARDMYNQIRMALEFGNKS